MYSMFFYLFITVFLCVCFSTKKEVKTTQLAQLASSSTSEWQLVKKSINNAEYWGVGAVLILPS